MARRTSHDLNRDPLEDGIRISIPITRWWRWWKAYRRAQRIRKAQQARKAA